MRPEGLSTKVGEGLWIFEADDYGVFVLDTYTGNYIEIPGSRLEAVQEALGHMVRDRLEAKKGAEF